jgi:hypothetical protein
VGGGLRARRLAHRARGLGLTSPSPSACSTSWPPSPCARRPSPERRLPRLARQPRESMR